MNLKMLTLIIFTLLLFGIEVNAMPYFYTKSYKPLAVRPETFPNRFKTKVDEDSKSLAVKADLWFALCAIGSLSSMWLIKGNKKKYFHRARANTL